MRKTHVTKIYVAFYIIAAVFTLALYFITLSGDDSDEEPTSYSETWFLDAEMTEEASLRRPKLTDGACVFYSMVPETVQVGDCLWFKSKNAYITVQIGGEERIRISESEDAAALYGKAPGTNWICVPLETTDAGAVIEIHFYTNYSDGSAYIDDMSVGNAVGSLRSTFSGMLLGTILCLLMLFFGAALIIVFTMVRLFTKNMPAELLYLGLWVFFTSIWSMSELRVMQLFTARNAGIFHNLTCTSLMLIAMPIILYFKKDLDRRSRLIVPGLMILTALNFLVCTVLHFTGIADFHETLLFTQITIGICAVFVIYANIMRLFKNPEHSKTDIPPAICMMLVAVGGVLDIAMYKLGISKDSSLLTRIALFLYAIALGVNSVMYIIQMMRKGMKADIVAHLAYEDGLTGLGNRTAYSERLEEITGSVSVIFVFDINNLKYVNDNIGHQAGDELIKTGADIILSVFGKIGKCYRTGGDEFVCLGEGNNIDAEAISEEFYTQIRTFNKSGVLGFPLMIALGWEKYDGEGNIELAVDSADHKMYQKKLELKQEEKGKYARKSTA